MYTASCFTLHSYFRMAIQGNCPRDASLPPIMRSEELSPQILSNLFRYDFKFLSEWNLRSFKSPSHKTHDNAKHNTMVHMMWFCTLYFSYWPEIALSANCVSNCERKTLDWVAFANRFISSNLLHCLELLLIRVVRFSAINRCR